MVDTRAVFAPLASQAPPQDEKVCRVLPGIELEELQKLVRVILAALHLPNIAIDNEHTIFARWLSRQFTSNPEARFYIDPAVIRSSRDEFLSLTNVRELIISIHDDLELNRKREIAAIESEENLQILQEFFDFFRPETLITDRVLLQFQADKLIQVVAILLAGATEETKKIIEIEEGTLPDWLIKAAETNSALTNYSNGIIKDIVAGFKEATPSAPRVIVRNTAISPIPLRKYLNLWLEKIYEEIPPTALPDKDYFEHTEFVVLKNLVDQPFVTTAYDSSDQEVAGRWQDILFAAIESYLKAKAGGFGAAFAQKKEEKTDEEETKLTATEDALLKTLEKFDAAGISYRQESARLTNELLPLFFSMHGLGNSLAELEFGLTGDELVEFSYIKRDFNAQLEYVLRQLTLEQIKALSTPSGRLFILRQLFYRLSTRREFVERIQQFAKKRAQVIVDLETAGQTLTAEQRQARLAFKLGEVYVLANNINRNLDQNQDRISQAFARSQINLDTLSTITSGIQDASWGDFQNLFHKLLNDNAAQLTTFKEALDAYVADRFDPERLRVLSPTQFAAIFGFAIPVQFLDQDKQPNAIYKQALNLAAEYVHLRRARLSNHYQTDSISQTVDSSADETKPLSTEELAQLTATKQRVAKYRGQGGAEVVIVARSSNQKRIAQFSDTTHGKPTHPYAKQIAEEHQFLEEQRIAQAESLDRTRRRALIARLIAETNFYDAQDGVLESHVGLPSETPIVPEYSGTGQEAISPLNDVSEFRDISPQRRPNIQRAKNSFGKAEQLLTVAETAAATAAGPVGQVYKALPKPVRRGLVVGAAALLLDAVSKFSTGVFSKVLGVGFGVGGGVGGFLIGGPVGATIGSFVGGISGTNLGYSLDKSLGLVGKSMPSLPSLPSLGGGALPAATTPAATALTEQAVAANLLKGVQGFLAKAVTPAAAPIWATGFIFTAAYISNMITTGAFLPPTLGSDGELSPYVTITKDAQEGNQFDNPTAATSINYQVTIAANKGYKLEINTLTDTFAVTAKDAAATPQTPTSPLSLTQLKSDPQYSAYFQGDILVLNPDQEITFTAYKIDFDSSYKDVAVTNTVRIQFTATKDAEVKTDAAQAQANVCFGDCPVAGSCSPGAVAGSGNAQIVSESNTLVNGLQPGFWDFLNNHPAYPNLFDEFLFGQNPAPNPAYAKVYRLASDSTGPLHSINEFVNALFWCTYNVIYSFQNAGKAIANNVAVVSMRKWFKDQAGQGRAVYIDDPGWCQIEPGDAVFFAKGDEPEAHVAIVSEIDNRHLTTYDSNNRFAKNTYPIGLDGKPEANAYTVKVNGVGRIP